MGQHGHVVVGLEFPRGAGEGAVEIAAIAHYFAGLVHAVQEFLLVGGGIESGVRRVVLPFHLQLLAALHGAPRGIGQHGDSAQLLEEMGLLERRELHRLHHALHLERFGIVAALDLGIVHRRALDGGVEHAGALGVHAEDGLARDDVVLIENRALLCRYSGIPRAA